jgi:hypothetical protein
VFKKRLKVPQERGLYAFTKHRRGDFILFVCKDGEDAFKFMQLPDRYKILLTQEEFTDGVTTKLLDFVEQVPQEVFEVAVANINDLENVLDTNLKK